MSQVDQTQPGYPCPICISERVRADEPACSVCQDVHGLQPEQHAEAVRKRIAIGPTDV